ncbi:MAG: hypothetical protein IIA41_00560 [SAR324 cluster bacterium]|nr:hypothetical protein [SAR324 cluster bacterium]
MGPIAGASQWGRAPATDYNPLAAEESQRRRKAAVEDGRAAVINAILAGE